jgi:hypothetical protein
MSIRTIFLVTLLLVSAVAVAEQPGCAGTEVPVNVIKANGDPVQGLGAQDFIAQARKDVVAVESITAQSGPRRILFVIDTTKKLSADARRLEVEFASGVVDAAQAEDTFGLLTARGITQSVKIGSDKEAIKRALKVLDSSAAESGDSREGPLDVVADGVSWFEQPQLGDAIVLLAGDLEDNRKANPKSVAKLLQDHRIRLFGVSLGPLQLTSSVAAGMAVDHDGFGYRQPGIPFNNNFGEANFLPLSVNSGGYVAPENTRMSSKQFKLSDEKRQQVHKTGELMGQLIDNVYAFHMKAPSRSEPWTVALTPAKLQAMPGAHVLYPHEVPACASSVASK